VSLFSSLRVPSVHGEEAVRLLDDGAVLLDVREKQEWNAGHAPTAKHLPLGRIAEAGRRLPAKSTVVVICRSGNRSRQATTALRSMGFNAFNYSGGMHSWARSGGAVVDRNNRPGRVV
jgi:rhodanese-related sulfurtransferase